ncbi:glycogenin-1-like [Oscarella lobularis]|uniref:glycogenin-1-like n=1 Tax=Oscarella lobularis TaxID=121494 RepID=UPI0033136428
MAPRTPAVADQAFVTLLTNDSYATGALVLAHSLHRVHTTRSLAVLVTSDVSQERREQLSAVFNLVQEVPRLDSEDAENLRLLNRPELGVTFTKINAWTLIQFNKCVFLDADTLVVRNVDDLFDRPELSAAPDVGWPDCFNSGVFVFKPDRSTYRALLEHAKKLGSFDGGDQGLLNSFWSNWACSDPSHRLPFVYNLTVSTSYSYAPALKRFGSDVRIIHFIGSIKPWHHSYSTAADQVILCPGTATTQEPVRKFLNIWWNIYITEIPSPYLVLTPPTPPLSPPYVSSGPYPDPSEPLPEAESEAWRASWEQGQIDYMGRDSFDRIQQHIDSLINSTETTASTETTDAPSITDEAETSA